MKYSRTFFQWVNRFIFQSKLKFKSKLKVKRPISPLATKPDIRVTDPVKSTLILNRKYEKDLEQAFFSWLLGCTQSDLQYNSKELQDKEQKILKILEQDIFSLDRLPRRPASFPILIRLLNDVDASRDEISRTLLSDPALTAKILKTVNSPFFRISTDPVVSIDKAVFILGIRGIRNIISATLMQPIMQGENQKEGGFEEKVWEWALIAATASDQYSHFQRNDSDPVYLLGLLPSLAYLVLYRALVNYQKVHPELGELEPQLVKSILQKRSWKLCSNICQQWDLPQSCQQYFLDAEQPSLKADVAPLRDGLCLGSHIVLQSHTGSPLDDGKVSKLTCAPNNIDRRVVQFLEKLKENSSE